MTRWYRPYLVALAAFALVGSHTTFAQAAGSAEKPTVALIDFDSQPGGYTLAPGKLGAVASQLMLNELSASNQFRIYDGQWLTSVFNPAPGRSPQDPRALIESAREAGVDYLVAGSITRLSNEQRRKGLGGGLLLFGGGGYKSKNDVALSIIVKVFDVHTGEIRMTAAADGHGVRTNFGGGAGLIAPVPVIAGISVRSLSSRDAQLFEAATQAAHELSKEIIANASTRLTAEVR